MAENMSDWENNKEIQLFREYLRIPSVHPNVDYTPCVDFLKRQAKDLGLPVQICYPGGPTKPIVIMTWLGKQPELPTIMLNSHMDVVPVYPEKWTHPPFAAEIDEQGRIFARGSQDIKCLGMQYLAAIRALKKKGATFKRSIHITFVPDEEISGILGMKCFVHTEDFRKLNVGFCLDEGVVNVKDEYVVYYAQKTIWYVNFTISGTTGHGSLLHKNTAAEKFQYILGKMLELRKKAENQLNGNRSLDLGNVNTVNLTVVKGGLQNNVIPPVIEATFDLRLGIEEDLEALHKQLQDWCEEAGGDITIKFPTQDKKTPPTAIDETNLFWVAMQNALKKLGLKVRTAVLPGVTDGRYVRQVNIPTLCFCPMANTPILLHANDEYLQADIYLKGIEIFENVLPAIANV
ncbi:PREDICTED: aminoacylase-1-like isoform X1 [Bactrocera latifrons]|uniref:aminoacylase-1-like isoform X1 n=2 Tax=Bactrocera latifrons TaxID=174628 RepID=UPI0008DD8B95|nr:PREDICTED: aminoacylase-1-like isoform X1 [Bactrocera latifrons]